ncbi:MAG TPA: malate synthase A [Polyangiaceae bacterium]|jgi:malate synthase
MAMTIDIRGARASAILSDEAVAFVADLQRTFGKAVLDLMDRRARRQAALDAGEERFDFLPETKHIRDGNWTCAPMPKDIRDRRVEITGPVDRKMIINALNSGARVFMADFEDSSTPTWANVVAGQQNLFEAVRRKLTFETPEKKYAIGDKPAVLFVRPRGLHLPERHVVVDGEIARGALVDFGLYFFHNAKELLSRGTGPYFYLPKLESHLEARLWNVVFLHAERALGIPQGTIKATVLIETLPAAFEMNEILYELREHSAGLNCGRWDYIFSFIKKQRAQQGVLPDRALVTMDKGFLRAYSRLLIETCHRRGVHAMGGMAAQIPIKSDAKKNEEALAKVRADKLREVKDGHDGTWVAHPGLVEVAMDVFDEHMKGANQIDVARPPSGVGQADLLAVPEGAKTTEGLRHNVRVGIQYLASWLRGQGCVPLYDLMEDAATAEISRAQVWQWLHSGTPIDGEPLTKERYRAVVDEELARLPDPARFDEARKLFDSLVLQERFEEFLTLPAYERLPGE